METIIHWLILSAVLYAINAAFFWLFGIFESHFWLERAQDEKNYDDGDMHDLLIKIRSVWFLVIYIAIAFSGTVSFSKTLKSFMLVFGLAATHAYWHLGSLYKHNNKLIPTIYKKGWKSDAGELSHSKLDKLGIMDNWEERRMWHIIGIAIMLVVSTKFYVIIANLIGSIFN